MPRSIAQLNILRPAASTRLAAIGEPRSVTASRRAMTSCWSMLVIGRLPQALMMLPAISRSVSGPGPRLVVDLGVALDEVRRHDLDGLRRGLDRRTLGLARVFAVGDRAEEALGLGAGVSQRQHRGVADLEVDLLAVDAGEQPESSSCRRRG